MSPALSPEVYEEQAAGQDWAITGVLDTHVHAAPFSRARRLANRTGATLYLPEQGRGSFSYKPLAEGAIVEVGSAVLKALRPRGTRPRA